MKKPSDKMVERAYRALRVADDLLFRMGSIDPGEVTGAVARAAAFVLTNFAPDDFDLDDFIAHLGLEVKHGPMGTWNLESKAVKALLSNMEGGV